jgi:hypothetical protein
MLGHSKILWRLRYAVVGVIRTETADFIQVFVNLLFDLLQKELLVF